MPPEGYGTITLPEEQIERIDDVVDANTRVAKISLLLAEYESDGREKPDGWVEDLANEIAAQVADEVTDALLEETVINVEDARTIAERVEARVQ